MLNNLTMQQFLERPSTRESLVTFGNHRHLVGSYHPVIHESRRLGFLCLTAGMLHHVGPSGLHVKLCRSLASTGITALRFDLSGIGESLPIAESGTSLERATKETQQAMDWMQKECGVERFVLFGLCSGADDALAVADQDSRVVGISMIDGLGYRTRRFHWERFRLKYVPRIVTPGKWIALAKRNILPKKEAKTLVNGDDIREFPPRDTAAQLLLRLLNKGVEMQLLYTGGVIDYYSYADQFWDMFPELDRRRFEPSISVNHKPMFDHVLSLRSDREAWIQRVVQWSMRLGEN
jgi:hypothetical protein